MTNIKNENYNVKQYLQEIIQRPLDIFHELTAWSEDDKKTFSILLETLKKPFDKTVETTKDKGDRLEKGLTGNEDEFRDANGLTKVLRIIEKYQNNKELFILTFTLEDYEKIAGGESFYDLVKAKKIAFRLSSEYDSFLKDFQHDNSDSIKQIIQNI